MNAAPLLIPVALLAATPGVELAYEAPRECPSRSDFAAAVAARGADPAASQATESHRAMVISIRRQGAGFVGAFQIRDEREATNRREVQGSTCKEVVEAMAVVT